MKWDGNASNGKKSVENGFCTKYDDGFGWSDWNILNFAT